MGHHNIFWCAAQRLRHGRERRDAAGAQLSESAKLDENGLTNSLLDSLSRFSKTLEPFICISK